MSSGFIPLPGGARIPLSEIRLRFSRSAGPGGQHVNRTETRVELEWDIVGSEALSAGQRDRLLAAFGGRVSGRGVLRLVCQQTRSQHRNRALLLDRLAELASAALRPRRRRQASRPTAAAHERRLAEKSRRAQAKRLRRPPTED